jgi:hypothetical protein
MIEAARTAWLAWDRFQNATTPTLQASALIDLSDAMSDLATWLPGYNYTTGKIEGE